MSNNVSGHPSLLLYRWLVQHTTSFMCLSASFSLHSLVYLPFSNRIPEGSRCGVCVREYLKIFLVAAAEVEPPIITQNVDWLQSSYRHIKEKRHTHTHTNMHTFTRMWRIAMWFPPSFKFTHDTHTHTYKESTILQRLWKCLTSCVRMRFVCNCSFACTLRCMRCWTSLAMFTVSMLNVVGGWEGRGEGKTLFVS